MVHAAATGAFNYANADPYDKKWRLRHVLLMREAAKNINAELLREIHAHWLAFVSHSGLSQESWDDVKRRADDLLQALKTTTHPWLAERTTETKTPQDTIYAKYGNLIDSYKAMVAEKTAAAKKSE